MKIDYNIIELLSQFKNLREFQEFLDEKQADPVEIARGKNELDKSKKEKEAEAEPEAAPEEGEEAAVAPPTIDPASAPGSQVAIGNKKLDKTQEPEAAEIKVKGGKTKVDTTPSIEVEPGFQ